MLAPRRFAASSPLPFLRPLPYYRMKFQVAFVKPSPGQLNDPANCATLVNSTRLVDPTAPPSGCCAEIVTVANGQILLRIGSARPAAACRR